MHPTPVDVVFSFDTTGSMYPCLTQVRRKLKETITRLTREIPSIRIGLIAHGDYCDAGTTYVTRHHGLSSDVEAISHFVEHVGQTSGGDAPECYELVLREAQSFAWRTEATKAFVLIGDDVPHAPAANPQRLNWRDEVQRLAARSVPVYGVQALNRRHATPFYRELAHLSGGFHLSLDQFAAVTDMLLAICYKQVSDEQLQGYEAEVTSQGRMSRGLNAMFTTMLGRAPAATWGAADLRAVTPGRFQMLDVDADVPIQQFVTENGLAFNRGRGFYEFCKTETIQGHKEVILMNRGSGDLFAGEAARELLGLPPGVTARIRPTHLEQYRVFVQSTSNNRKLQRNTRFLYEVDDYDRSAAA